jgi:hypothetical protein
MGTNRGKKQEDKMLKTAEADRAAIQETSLEKMYRERAENFLRQSQGGGGVESIDLLKPYLQLFNRAANDQQNQRTSTGVLQLGAQNANPNQAAAYNAYLNYKRQQDAAGTLENAYNAANSEVAGQSFDLAQMANSRNLGKAGLSQQAYSTYLNRPKSPPLWQQIAQTVIGGAQAAGGMMSGAGAMGATF